MSIFQVASLIICLTLCLPAAALAQSDTPYSPQKTPLHELLITERFDESPIAFPWELISTDRIANRGRLDFELIYDIDFRTVHSVLSEAYPEARDFIELKPQALNYTDVTHLRMAGMELANHRARISVGHPDMEHIFTVVLEADGPRTRVIVHNTTSARQFSGFMPSRVGFKPAAAEIVPFRWN